MSIKSITTRISHLLSDFVHAVISSIFEMKPAVIPVRVNYKPRGYGRPVTEILFSRRR